MATYTIHLEREHATWPTVCWCVRVWDLVNGSTSNEENGRHMLFVPRLDAWMPDTVRLVLYELSAYIPAHDPNDARVRIEAALEPRRGRAPKVPRPARFNHDVGLAVEARGWRAEVRTACDDRPVKPETTPPHPGWFSEPMQAFLMDLAAQSPFLARVRYEHSAAGSRLELYPSRLNVQYGDEAPWDPKTGEWRDDLADATVRANENLRKLRGAR